MTVLFYFLNYCLQIYSFMPPFFPVILQVLKSMLLSKPVSKSHFLLHHSFASCSDTSCDPRNLQWRKTVCLLFSSSDLFPSSSYTVTFGFGYFEVKLLSHVRLFVIPWTVFLPGSIIHGVFQARVLEWVTISFSRGSSLPRDWTPVSRIVGRRFIL